MHFLEVRSESIIEKWLTMTVLLVFLNFLWHRRRIAYTVRPDTVVIMVFELFNASIFPSVVEQYVTVRINLDETPAAKSQRALSRKL